MENVTATQNADGSESSRRIAALFYPIPIYLAGIFGTVASVFTNAGQWPVIGCMGLIVAGVVLQLFLFGLITKTDIAEILASVKVKNE